MHVRQKEKVGMPVASERAAVKRGMCETEKVDEGAASGKCEDEHPVVTMMFWPINDTWCMGDGIDVIILQNRREAKNKAIFFKWKWKWNDRGKAKYLWNDLNKEK